MAHVKAEREKKCGEIKLPVVNRARRLMVETLAANINELVLGFDGSYATADDTAAGRPVVKLTPVVTVINEAALMIHAKIGTQYTFDDTLKEVFVQHRATDGTYTPIARFNMPPIPKDDMNEYDIQIIMEVG